MGKKAARTVSEARDPQSFMRVAFVMKGGVVYRQPPVFAGPSHSFP